MKSRTQYEKSERFIPPIFLMILIANNGKKKELFQKEVLEDCKKQESVKGNIFWKKAIPQRSQETRSIWNIDEIKNVIFWENFDT